MEQEINLVLSVAETNGVLQALGNMPFAQVAQLVQKIQQQAAPQVKTNGAQGIEQVVQ